ncbi:PLP-dependent aminotransferase family protein [Aureimonas fodinaquatilis]|uniref:PLP-dependent aminotransferase family protein n=1 Tax=Aureimonas fodinaquatilis TaxID=2565783 RepID=A0A5B0DQH2_9HYPH|nr:PLP-dependent aminotransferase family protein [Aureimonas fodinaquatilis]KAA0968225.1 PLP-dependent aminotransferase family protein [Aureimonas fodinaquatilis]
MTKGRVRTSLGARQIYEALKDQIRSGVFGDDGQLPSSRILANELCVSRTTVTAAYEQLLAEGFITVRQGSRPRTAAAVHPAPPVKAHQPSAAMHLSAFGQRVSSMPEQRRSQAAGRLVADFRYGDLAQSDFPAVNWKRAMNAAMATRPDRLAYDDPRGSQRLRKALQGYLWRARMLQCEPEQIVVVNGSQQGLDLCARLLLDADDKFVIENPCYAMARQIFSSTGAAAVPIDVDGEGMQTGALADVSARLAYVTPSHQFPLGGVMPVSRRQQLLEWAQRNDACVIEDDYDSEYRYDISPIPTLYGLAKSHVIYLGTISKTLSPMLRIGYLVIPYDLQQVFATAKQLTDRHSPVAEQEALASLIESGLYERHVRKVRRLNGQRREMLMGALARRFGDSISIEGADAGLHLVLWFRDLPAALENELVDGAREAGLGVYSVSRLYQTPAAGFHAGCLGLIMGYAALDARQIARGVDILAQVVARVQAFAFKGT